MVGVEVHADSTTPVVGDHRDMRQFGRGEHPPSLGIPVEPVADRLAQICGTSSLFAMLAAVLSLVIIALQRSQHLIVAVGESHAR